MLSDECLEQESSAGRLIVLPVDDGMRSFRLVTTVEYVFRWLEF